MTLLPDDIDTQIDEANADILRAQSEAEARNAPDMPDLAAPFSLEEVQAALSWGLVALATGVAIAITLLVIFL